MNEAVRVLSAEAIEAQAERHIDDYLDGGYDLEAEDIAAAAAAGVDPRAIIESWAHAKTLRPSGPKLPKPKALFISPAPQPRVVSETKVAASFVRRRLPDDEPLPASIASPAPEPEPARAPSTALVVAAQALPAASQDHTIAAMNEHHAIIDNVGGKTVIACWEPSPLDPAKLVVVFQTKDSFLLAVFQSPRARWTCRAGALSSVPIGHYWLGHRERRQYRGVTFAPAGPKVINECLNLWQGWGVDAKPRRLGTDPRAYRRRARGRQRRVCRLHHSLDCLGHSASRPASRGGAGADRRKGRGEGHARPMLTADLRRSCLPSHQPRRGDRQIQRPLAGLHSVRCRRSVLGRRQALRWAPARNDNRADVADRAEGDRCCSSAELSACGDAGRAGLGHPCGPVRAALCRVRG